MYCLERNKKKIIGNTTITTNTGIVCERLSIGKKLVSLILIELLKDTNIETNEYFYKGKTTCNYNCSREYICTLEQIDCTTLNTTVILTNQNGFQQWEDYIEKLKGLTVYKIQSLQDIQQFNCNRHWDVILIKLKTITIDNNKVSILKCFNDAFENVKFKRFIIDNFNDLRLTYNDPLVIADFTWILTKKIRRSNGSRLTIKDNIKSGTIESYLGNDYYCNAILNLCNDRCVQEFFTIKFDYHMIKDYYKFPLIESYNLIVQQKKIELIKKSETIVYEDLDNNLVTRKENTYYLPDNLITLLENNQVIELSKALEISCNSISELYSRLLDNSNDKYISLGNLIKKVNSILNLDFEHTDYKENSRQLKELYSYIKLSSSLDLQNSLLNKKIGKKVSNEKLTELCTSIKNELIEKQEKIINPLKRLYDNAIDSECQCCFIPLQNDHVFVIHCCQLILCIDCIFVDCHLINKCPKCMTLVESINDFSYINFDFNVFKNNINIDKILDNSYNTIIDKSNAIKTLIHLLTDQELTISKAIDNIKLLTNLIGDIDNKCPKEGESTLIYTSNNYIYLLEKEVKYNLVDNLQKIQIVSHVKNIKDAKDITKIIFYGKISLNERKKVVESIQTLYRQYNLTIYRITIDYVI
jgi:hypothetical protein